MKIRESGMPPSEQWDDFFDAPAVLRTLGLTGQTGSVVEFGCGYGTFTIPAARFVQGEVYAIDIDTEMLAVTRARAESANLTNVFLCERDFAIAGTGLPDGSVDYVMLFNILHAEERMELLTEAWRVLADGGKLAVIHWNYDSSTPRGPSMDIRPRPDDCLSWAEKAGFRVLPPGRLDLPPHHYGFVFRKQS